MHSDIVISDNVDTQLQTRLLLLVLTDSLLVLLLLLVVLLSH